MTSNQIDKQAGLLSESKGCTASSNLLHLCVHVCISISCSITLWCCLSAAHHERVLARDARRRCCGRLRGHSTHSCVPLAQQNSTQINLKSNGHHSDITRKFLGVPHTHDHFQALFGYVPEVPVIIVGVPGPQTAVERVRSRVLRNKSGCYGLARMSSDVASRV